MKFPGASPGWRQAVWLVLSIALFTFSVAALPVLALSEDQLVAKLNAVPVFTIIDAKGSPLLLIPKQQKDIGILNFYLDSTLAQQAIKLVKDQNPDKGKVYQVASTALGRAYTAIKQEREKKDSKVRFQFLSSPASIQYAYQVAKKKDPNLKNFQGVPVFFLTGGDRRGILTLKRNGQEFLPMFFSEVDLQRNLAALRKGRSDLPGNLSVEVATLDSVVGTMLSGQSDKDAEKITFIPSRAALEYAKTLQKPK
ncbi:Tic22 family protein [Gloeobacter kilaueensis]|uniref:Tic22 family protein n=1 Tax=Gloeobacter kilaueensis (strain ATCC BAA-2537 / CCAP 1431/1 / ULC 316 / JS1) TaxID=1183438 RepID=U5QEX6_GLOK1|nr:Tic22 family protein [Gloeobacter kilaueensis]AGY57471.1 hypothetical protein GKIL_1225 [Gloeobacter kilaueensis JS1]